jgi:hypothetical protein
MYTFIVTSKGLATFIKPTINWIQSLLLDIFSLFPDKSHVVISEENNVLISEMSLVSFS